MEAFAPTTTAAAFYACALVSYDDLKKILTETGVSTALREKIRAGRFSGTRDRTTDRPEVALSITDLPPPRSSSARAC